MQHIKTLPGGKFDAKQAQEDLQSLLKVGLWVRLDSVSRSLARRSRRQGERFAAVMTCFVSEKITVIVLSNADQEGFGIGDMANEIASFYFD